MIASFVKKETILPLFLVLCILLSGCAPAQPAVLPTQTETPAPIPSTSTSTPSSTPLPTLTATPTRVPSPTLTPTPTLAPMGEFMKGMILAGIWRGQFLEPTSDWIMVNLVKPLGPNWIRINISCRQKDLRATTINCDFISTQTDEELIHVTQLAHRLGLRVMLDFSSGLEEEGVIWHGQIGQAYGQAAWADWFKSYTAHMVRYGKLAEQYHMDAFNFASELESTVHREQDWRDAIAAVRQVYHGPLLFSLGDEASWERVNFWDAVDYIGLHPYNFALAGSRKTSLEDMTAAWQPVVTRLEKLSRKWDRPIIFTEIGYPSVDGIAMDMNNSGRLWDVDLQESADLYQAVIDSFAGKDWFQGLFPLGIFSYGNPVEAENFLFTIAHKPASEVIRKFYGAPPLPTQPADPALPAEFKNIQVIYDDQLRNGWYDPKNIDPTLIDFKQTDTAVSGSAIKVRLRRWEEFILRHDPLPTDYFTLYQWLEFYLFVPLGSPNPLFFEVSLRNGNFMMMPNFVLLPPSRYLPGGTQVQGEWQQVLIPIQALGPIVSPIENFVVNLAMRGPATVYFDQIRLLGN